MNNEVKIKGFIRLQTKDTEGQVLQDTGWMQNTITNASFAVFSGLAGNVGSQTAFTYLALGTGTTSDSASLTALTSEIVDTGLARAAATVTRSTTTQTNDTLQLDYTWTASGVKVVAEIGVFNDSSSGVMAARKKLTSTITTANTNAVAVTYKIIFA